LACVSWCSGTISGTIASNAGPKNAVPAPNTAAITIRCHSCSEPLSDRSPSAPTAPPRSTSAAIITRRRSNRSLTTPPSSNRAMWGIVIAMPTTDSAVGASESW
jgi:hypothetical protein